MSRPVDDALEAIVDSKFVDKPGPVDVRQVDPSLLSQMIAWGQPEAGTPEPTVWGEHELTDILRHQLTADLLFDSARPEAGGGPAGGNSPSDGTAGINSFGELLRHPTPPLDLLLRVKDFGKSSSTDPNGPVPQQVGTLLYYAAITAALLRHGRRITQMDDKTLRKGMAWVLSQPWVDEPTRGLFREGLGRVPAE